MKCNTDSIIFYSFAKSNSRILLNNYKLLEVHNGRKY